LKEVLVQRLVVSRIRVAFTLAGMVGLIACGGSSAPSQPANVTPVDSASAGTITVRVRFAGESPAPTEINMRAVGACAQLHTAPVFDQPIIVRDGRLADTVVYIKSGLGERTFNFPTTPVTIDQKGCLYTPKVAALMVGQPLQFVNSDPEAHNVHGTPSVVKGWNFIMSQPNSSRTVYFDKPEVGIPVRCDIHPWMLAHVSVFTHPYFGVSGQDGTVSLTQVPAGTYVIAAWHRELGATEQTVTLYAKASVTLELTYTRSK
jgi:plastocyanin